tara:strand:+ start:4694 stop:5101 length:408 start_codon:yes stop_codon:yes gene_type:complete
MAAETDLARLLAGLAPVLDTVPFGFVVLAHGKAVPAGVLPFALVQEAEGQTVIAPCAMLDAAGIAVQGRWAHITITAHSALAAVGLTAAMATALSAVGISANVVAAFHHDHLFVPWDRRDQALAVLIELARAASR